MKKLVSIVLLLALILGVNAGPPIGLRIAAPKPAATGGGGATLLLDESGLSGATAAYSVARKLRSAYSGSAIRVRRSSDSTEQDIGFSGDVLNSSSLASFCSGTDGFIVTIYDQTGNGHDITQATTSAQPQIVSSGTILTGSNSKPRADFSAGTSVRLVNTSINITQPNTHFSIFRVNVWTSNRRVFDGTTSIEEGRQNLYLSSTTPDIRFGTAGTSGIINSTLSVGSWGIIKAVANNTSGELRVNAGTAVTGSVGATKLRGFTMGATEGGGTGANCDFHEHVIWPSALDSTDGATARNNVNAFYAVF